MDAEEAALLEIIDEVRAQGRALDPASVESLLRRRNRQASDGSRRVIKRHLLPYYRYVKEREPGRWASWDVSPAVEEALCASIKMKPRRTASGVATITVITKPWPCSSNCRYCPCDIRMPKSYLAAEPACQRAEHNYFDPYLQVKARLHVLQAMGHATDKIELIVLGGTWNDYPLGYQLWFVCELFRALNDGLPYLGGPELPTEAGEAPGDGCLVPEGDGPAASTSAALAAPMREPALSPDVAERACAYARLGIGSEPEALAEEVRCLQARIDEGAMTYNQAFAQRYGIGAWDEVSNWQRASWEDVEREQRTNERAGHRVVGLCIETRPDLISAESLYDMRRLGCTKIQMGVQSLDQRVLDRNGRHVSVDQIAVAFALLRLFGFKIQIHFMTNLLGSSLAADRADYLRLVEDPRFLPDEVKLYPCCLVESARLKVDHARGAWQPYPEDELVNLLVDDVLATPAYTRISRMIRDISSDDIIAGSKKTNLRQMVERRLAADERPVREIRLREIATDDVSRDNLRLDAVCYASVVSDECFLQWVTPEDRIAGFLRLSLPKPLGADGRGHAMVSSPIPAGEAMIREVHVYGRVARLEHSESGAAQHTGLGKALIEEACLRAREAGYGAINVISSVGTREYYRNLGFVEAGLYQRRPLA